MMLRLIYLSSPHQEFMTAAHQPAFDYFCGLQASVPMVNWWQHPWTGWCLTMEFLE
jgi:hypothetical protein